MEARQQQIAELARHMLPFVEAHEQKDKFVKITYRLLILSLTAILSFSSSQLLRPISYSEEKTLSILLEHNAMQDQIDVSTETERFLDYLDVKRLGDIRAWQWNDALYRLTREPP